MTRRKAPLQPESPPGFLSAFSHPQAPDNDAFVFGHRLPAIGAKFVSRWLGRVTPGGTTAGTKIGAFKKSNKFSILMMKFGAP